MRAAAAALAALLLAVAGCGDGAPPTETAPPPPSGTGWFVGSEGGIGATLDMRGDDPVSRSVERALASEAGAGGEAPDVGIASIVNETASGFDAPRFIAILESGRGVTLTPALEALRGVRGPAARQARARLRAEPARVPSRSAGVAYLVLRGASVDRIASVTMAAGPQPAITLAARRR
ncbi:MAG TPA: hypothetical protein VFG74_15355 [Miltoncostaeaceae bacterium]|nr:hypothetical protein [Miltoncostaeaceae bacterium]